MSSTGEEVSPVQSPVQQQSFSVDDLNSVLSNITGALNQLNEGFSNVVQRMDTIAAEVTSLKEDVSSLKAGNRSPAVPFSTPLIVPRIQPTPTLNTLLGQGGHFGAQSVPSSPEAPQPRRTSLFANAAGAESDTPQLSTPSISIVQHQPFDFMFSSITLDAIMKMSEAANKYFVKTGQMPTLAKHLSDRVIESLIYSHSDIVRSSTEVLKLSNIEVTNMLLDKTTPTSQKAFASALKKYAKPSYDTLPANVELRNLLEYQGAIFHACTRFVEVYDMLSRKANQGAIIPFRSPGKGGFSAQEIFLNIFPYNLHLYIASTVNAEGPNLPTDIIAYAQAFKRAIGARMEDDARHSDSVAELYFGNRDAQEKQSGDNTQSRGSQLRPRSVHALEEADELAAATLDEERREIDEKIKHFSKTPSILARNQHQRPGGARSLVPTPDYSFLRTLPCHSVVTSGTCTKLAAGKPCLYCHDSDVNDAERLKCIVAMLQMEAPGVLQEFLKARPDAPRPPPKHPAAKRVAYMEPDDEGFSQGEDVPEDPDSPDEFSA